MFCSYPIYVRTGMHLFFVFFLIFGLVSETQALQISNQDRSLIAKEMKSVSKILNLASSFGIATKYLGETKNNESKANIEKFLLSLLKAELASQSDFKSKIVDLSELEAIWEKSIEFNNKDFEELYAQANFSHILIANYMIYEEGLEFNFDIFQTDGEAIGSSVFTSGQIMLDIPWERYQEAQILSATDAEALRLQVEQLTEMNSIVEDPKRFEEFYANYILYLRSGDELQAVENLAAAISLNPIYVDLIDDVTTLARSAFGASGARDFLQSTVYQGVSKEFQHYSKLLMDPNYNIFPLCNLDTHRLNDCKIEVDSISTVPLLNLFLKVQGERFQTNSENWGIDTVRLYVILQSARAVIESYKNGNFSDFYFDKLRAKAEIDVGLAFDLEAKHNTARYEVYNVKNYVLGSAPFIALPADDDGEPGITKENCNGLSCVSLQTFEWEELKFFSPSQNTEAPISEDTFEDLHPVGGMVGGARDIINFLGPQTLGPCQSGRSGMFQSFGEPEEDAARIAFFWTETERAKKIAQSKKWLEENAAIYSEEQKNQEWEKQKQEEQLLTELPLLDWSDRQSITSLFDASYQRGNKVYNQLILPSGLERKMHLDKALNANNDRLLWADFCYTNLSLAKYPPKAFVRQDHSGVATLDFQILGSLYITDQVDTTKPIIISSYGRGEDVEKIAQWSVTDISIDGTLFDPNGLNLDTTQFVRGINTVVLHKNKWLSAPGYLQSSIAMESIESIAYTDIFGNKKVVKPSVGNDLSAAPKLSSNTIFRAGDQYIDPIFPMPDKLYQRVKDRSDELYALVGLTNEKLFDQMKFHFESFTKEDKLTIQSVLLSKEPKSFPIGIGLDFYVWNDPFQKELFKYWRSKNFDFNQINFDKTAQGRQAFIQFINNYEIEGPQSGTVNFD